MRPLVLLSAAFVAASASVAGAQTPSINIPAGVAGTWEGKSMIGPKDSVVTGVVMTATAKRKGWVTKVPNRDPVPTRVIAAGGDSVVTESGPYNSVVRPGQQVTVRTTGHYNGDTMTGTFVATYANGDVVKGKSTGTRKK